MIAYFSKVQVGDCSWLIYPVSYRTSEGADNGAAKKALNELRMPTIDQKTNGDVPTQAADHLLHNLVQLFTDDESLFTEALEKEFLAKFGHKLEANWLDQVENSKVFDVQK